MKFDGFVNISGRKIRCLFVEHPESERKPIIVVFPGGPGFGYGLYRQHSGFLEEEANVLYFDPAGCGESDARESVLEYTMENYVMDVRSILQKIDIEQPVIVFGTSYGSMAALKFALMYPEMLLGLILVGGACSHYYIDEAKANLKRLGSVEQQKICETLWNGTFQTQDEVSNFFKVMGSMYSLKAKNAAASQVGSDATVVAPYAFPCSLGPLNKAFSSRCDKFDFRGKMNQILVPALLLFGEHDWINTPDQAKQIHSEVADSELHVIKDSGHSVAKDQPDIYEQLLRGFLHCKFGRVPSPRL